MKSLSITLLLLSFASRSQASPIYACDNGAGAHLQIQIDTPQTLKLIHFYKGSDLDIVLSQKVELNTPDGFTNFVGESGCLPSSGSPKPSCGAIAYFDLLVSQGLMNSDAEGTVIYINNTYKCSAGTDSIEL